MRTTIQDSGFHLTLCDVLDESTAKFQQELVLKSAANTSIDIAWCHRQEYLREQPRFLLLMIRDSNNEPIAQWGITVREQLRGLAPIGELMRCGASQNSLVKALPGLLSLLKEHTPLVSLRLQLFDPDQESRAVAAQSLRDIGFQNTPPQSYPRTLWLKIPATMELLRGTMNSKNRNQVKRTSEQLVLRNLQTQPNLEWWAEGMHASLKSAYQRTGRSSAEDPIRSLLKWGLGHPDQLCVLGLSEVSSDAPLLAFVLATRGLHTAEYFMAGSQHNPILRTMPFNVVLLWGLVEWSQTQGCKFFDYSGITNGGPDDPLAGVSTFKRKFPGEEIQIADELICDLNPGKAALSRGLASGVQTLRQKLHVATSKIRRS